MPKGQIQAVSFDVGGTLISPNPSVGDVYTRVAARHGFHNLNSGELDRRFHEAWKKTEGFTHSRAAWERMVDATFEGLINPRPSQSFFPELYEAFAHADAWRIHEDVIPTLEELASRGIPLAITSNWDERLRPLLIDLRLSSYFETILISSEVYFAKPSNVIFDHVVRNLGVPANNILHVGDSESEDYNGAENAGMQTLLIDRSRDRAPKRIRQLTEVLEHLDPSIQDSKRD